MRQRRAGTCFARVAVPTARDEHGKWLKGQSANPVGRLPGTKNKRSQTALALMEQWNFDPFEKKIKLARNLEAKLLRNHFKDPYERIEYLKLYCEVLRDLLQYAYPRLKQVEHIGQIEVIQKLQALDHSTDEELQALLAEAEELAHALA